MDTEIAVNPNNNLSVSRLILRHCQLMILLALYSLTEQATAIGFQYLHWSEPLLVRIIRVIFELTLGVLLLKRAANEITNEFAQIHFHNFIDHSITLHSPKPALNPA